MGSLERIWEHIKNFNTEQGAGEEREGYWDLVQGFSPLFWRQKQNRTNEQNIENKIKRSNR